MNTRASSRTPSIVLSASPLECAAAPEELLRSAFERSPSGISVFDLDGRWLQINRAYCRMRGYEPEELIGAAFEKVTHPDDVAADREFVAAAIAGKLDSSVREKRNVCKDGSLIWVRVRAEVIRDAAGEALYFVSHLQDIGERRAVCVAACSTVTLDSMLVAAVAVCGYASSELADRVALAEEQPAAASADGRWLSAAIFAGHVRTLAQSTASR
jgi:PAS domain S-box-containing protein